MNKKYQYKCIDQSILTPSYRKYIAAPVLKIIPIGVNPNIITGISFIFSLMGLFIAYYYNGFFANTIIAIFIFSYVLFDHIDGMQAKRKGENSALGEFLDHFFDVLVTGIVVFSMYFLFDIINQTVLIIIFASSYIAQAMVFLEQRESGWLHFGKVESLEAIMFLCLIIFLNGFNIVRSFFTENIFYGWRLIDWLFVISSVIGLKVIFESYRRIKWKIWSLSILILTVGSIIYISLSLNSGLNVPLLITISAILIIQEYLIGQLTNKQFIIVDFLPITLFILLVVLLKMNAFIFILIIATIALVRFIITVNVLSNYRKFDLKYK